MCTQIGVKLQVEGFHFWPNAPESVRFLQDNHRHTFHFECLKKVNHDDRDIEFILFKRLIEGYLVHTYGKPCQFGPMSCEMIAKELIKEFQLTSCRVSEDDENFAIVTV